jgi:hypothetical protein
MPIKKNVRKKIVNARTKLTGNSPYLRAKAKVDNLMNPKISSFAFEGKMHKVVSRRSVNALVKLANNKTVLAEHARNKLRQLQNQGVLVKERGLGRTGDNPHLEIIYWEKLTEPKENISKIKPKKRK